MLRLLLVDLLDYVLDLLDGGPAQPMGPVEARCLCPVCSEDLFRAEPHLHGVFVVHQTEWPAPGVLVTFEPE